MIVRASVNTLSVIRFEDLAGNRGTSEGTGKLHSKKGRQQNLRHLFQEQWSARQWIKYSST